MQRVSARVCNPCVQWLLNLSRTDSLRLIFNVVPCDCTLQVITLTRGRRSEHTSSTRSRAAVSAPSFQMRRQSDETAIKSVCAVDVLGRKRTFVAGYVCLRRSRVSATMSSSLASSTHCCTSTDSRQTNAGNQHACSTRCEPFSNTQLWYSLHWGIQRIWTSPGQDTHVTSWQISRVNQQIFI
jgi:hypothetical protein